MVSLESSLSTLLLPRASAGADVRGGGGGGGGFLRAFLAAGEGAGGSEAGAGAGAGRLAGRPVVLLAELLGVVAMVCCRDTRRVTRWNILIPGK